MPKRTTSDVFTALLNKIGKATAKRKDRRGKRRDR